MTIQTPIRYAGGRYTIPTPIFNQAHWDEVHDALVLALDALGDGPSTTDREFCDRNLSFARSMLKRARRRADKWAERERRQSYQEEVGQ